MENFGDLIEDGLNGKLTEWQSTPEHCLSYIILLDQFTRNSFRDTAKVFTGDPFSLKACLEGEVKEFDKSLFPPFSTGILW